MKRKVVFVVLGVFVLLASLWVANRQVGFVGRSQTVNIDKGVFPWDDVESCIDENTVELSSKCFWCGRHKKRVSFRSPAYTWGNLCGIAGNLIICEHCKMQYDFEMICRN